VAPQSQPRGDQSLVVVSVKLAESSVTSTEE
jgi:hypothetical protein